MNERAYVSRSAVIVAGVAAILTFLAIAWLRGTLDRVPTPARDRRFAASERRATAPFATASPSAIGTDGSLTSEDDWTPEPPEFVKLTAAVSLYNSRGKEVKHFQPGKRLRVSKREGDQVTIDYLGDEYTIAAKSTVPSQ